MGQLGAQNGQLEAQIGQLTAQLGPLGAKMGQLWALYLRGRSGAENQVKCSILIPDRDDRSVHETWAANISTHIIIKE